MAGAIGAQPVPAHRSRVEFAARSHGEQPPAAQIAKRNSALRITATSHHEFTTSCAGTMPCARWTENLHRFLAGSGLPRPDCRRRKRPPPPAGPPTGCAGDAAGCGCPGEPGNCPRRAAEPSVPANPSPAVPLLYPRLHHRTRVRKRKLDSLEAKERKKLAISSGSKRRRGAGGREKDFAGPPRKWRGWRDAECGDQWKSRSRNRARRR